MPTTAPLAPRPSANVGTPTPLPVIIKKLPSDGLTTGINIAVAVGTLLAVVAALVSSWRANRLARTLAKDDRQAAIELAQSEREEARKLASESLEASAEQARVDRRAATDLAAAERAHQQVRDNEQRSYQWQREQAERQYDREREALRLDLDTALTLGEAIYTYVMVSDSAPQSPERFQALGALAARLAQVPLADWPVSRLFVQGGHPQNYANEAVSIAREKYALDGGAYLYAIRAEVNHYVGDARRRLLEHRSGGKDSQDPSSGGGGE